jgi:hypothetical protein
VCCASRAEWLAAGKATGVGSVASRCMGSGKASCSACMVNDVVSLTIRGGGRVIAGESEGGQVHAVGCVGRACASSQGSGSGSCTNSREGLWEGFCSAWLGPYCMAVCVG